MKGYLNKLFGDIKGAINSEDPSANPAGWKRLQQEEMTDKVSNAIGSPFVKSLKGIGRFAITKPGMITFGALGLGIGAISLARHFSQKHHNGQDTQKRMNSFAGATAVNAALLVGGGTKGLLMGAGAIGGGLAASIGTTAKTMEHIGRGVLIPGGRKMAPTDAWFPFLKVLPKTDIRKYMLNPSIIKRAVGIGAAVSLLAGPLEALKPQSPPATAYFDGVNMRRSGDMGAHAGYGQAVLGSNSSLNGGMGYDVIAQRLSHFI